MKRALVTGASGFVGGYMCRALGRLGYEVIAIDIQQGRHQDARDFFRSDTRPFDLAVHLAAVVGGRATIEGEPLSVAVDLSIDAEFFGWLLRAQPKQAVYYSSSAAYPTRWQQRGAAISLYEDLIDLGDVRQPDLTYGWSKLTGEYLAQFAARAGHPVIVVRPFSGYGTDQSLDYPFPSFIDRGRRQADPFQVWGDGTQCRDWIHITDVVRLTLQLVQAGYEGPAVNLGTGVSTPFADLADLVMGEFGYAAPIEFIPTAPTGVHTRVASTARMEALGLEPRVGLRDGIAWAREGRLE